MKKSARVMQARNVVMQLILIAYLKLLESSWYVLRVCIGPECKRHRRGRLSWLPRAGDEGWQVSVKAGSRSASMVLKAKDRCILVPVRDCVR